ncbi:hypothetical protein MCEREM21A_00615 [Sphingomonadaceae bacterium]
MHAVLIEFLLLTETLTKLADGYPANNLDNLMPWINVG